MSMEQGMRKAMQRDGTSVAHIMKEEGRGMPVVRRRGRLHG
jgi:hypothetical protein